MQRVGLFIRMVLLVASIWITDAISAPVLIYEHENGNVLLSKDSTQLWYPASLSKLMTTYVVFDLIRKGVLTLQSKVHISAKAAQQPQSKIGLPSGSVLTLENALKLMLVKSANDIAYAIAESVGGTIPRFAEMMNAQSRQLNLRESHWVNPSGLFDPEQVSSARDLAILTSAIIDEFPQFLPFFQIKGVIFQEKRIPNHNDLLRRYTDVVGMKTGYICESGFNIIITILHENRHIVMILLGEPSTKARNLKLAFLISRLDDFLERSTNYSLKDIKHHPDAQVTNLRERVCRSRSRSQADLILNQKRFERAIYSSLTFSPSGNTYDASKTIQIPKQLPFEPITVWADFIPKPNITQQRQSNAKAMRNSGSSSRKHIKKHSTRTVRHRSAEGSNRQR